MMLRSFRSSHKGPVISIFKGTVAKAITMKYSNEGDTIFDYSCGWGARLLGACSSNRKYIGTDPLTTPELTEIAKFLDLKDYTLINSGSENYRGEENSIDLSYSSPPYLTKNNNKEVFSLDDTQAYSQGEDYFYNVYWKKTLENCKYMLKPNKWFGLNLTEDCVKMINMAKEVFGEPVEIFKLRLVKSHLSGKSKDKENSIKHEPVFMFKNIK